MRKNRRKTLHMSGCPSSNDKVAQGVASCFTIVAYLTLTNIQHVVLFEARILPASWKDLRLITGRTLPKFFMEYLARMNTKQEELPENTNDVIVSSSPIHRHRNYLITEEAPSK